MDNSSGPSAEADKRWRAYLINLDRSTDRLEAMRERLDKHDIKWQRVTAVDGKEMRESDFVGVDTKGFARSHGRYIIPGDIGCYLSHIKALQAFLETDEPFALILEDDVDFGDDIKEVIALLIEEAAHWDVVKLVGRHSGWPVPLVALGQNYRLVAFLTRHTGSAAYLVNRFAARRYLERLLPIRVPYDHMFDRAWYFGFKFRGVLPSPLRAQVSRRSTIVSNVKLEKPLKYKLPKLAYRSVNEIQRGLYYASRGLIVPRTSWPKKNKSG